jgi:hypothetical protein
MIATRALLALMILASLPAAAQMPPAAGAQMPDPKTMSGVPLPTPDLPPGTLTVRVILGALDKPIAGVTVEVTGGRRSETGESGRAEFSGLQPGSTIKAFTVVGGERLESQDIRLPSNGGVRVMLVATDPELEKRAAQDRKLAEGPAQRGTVVIGGDSRFVFELGDEGLNVFNLFQILNTARVPIDPGGPLVFELPGNAEHVAMLEGSSKLATAAGKRIEVKGPFPPGTTMVQFAYTLPYSGDSLTVRQVMPAPLAQVTVIAQKVGATHLSSPQMTQHGEREANGQTYILGQGPAVAAGGAVEFAFSGLPHTLTWPRNLALSLAVLILLGGAFYSIAGLPQATGGAERKRLEARREKLFAELTALEESHRAGRVDPAHYTTRRQQLIASLERVYAALDEEAAA